SEPQLGRWTGGFWMNSSQLRVLVAAGRFGVCGIRSETIFQTLGAALAADAASHSSDMISALQKQIAFENPTVERVYDFLRSEQLDSVSIVVRRVSDYMGSRSGTRDSGGAVFKMVDWSIT